MVRRPCRHGDGIAVVVGKAGSGKTAALAAAHDAWHASGFHVLGCALAGRAAQELHAAARIPSHTIDRLLGWLDTGDPRGRLTARSVLVVHEAGMVDTRTLARLARHATRARATLVLVGDHHQLPEIGAGGAFRGLVDRLDPITLHTNRRQHHVWERAALDELRDGDPARAVHAYAARGRVTTTKGIEALREQLVDDWWHTTRTDGAHSGVMIALRVADEALGQLRVTADRRQVDQLLRFACASTCASSRLFVRNSAGAVL
jgi:ATP-dependent exoDNAse (exonuclease V) alpha subunit